MVSLNLRSLVTVAIGNACSRSVKEKTKFTREITSSLKRYLSDDRYEHTVPCPDISFYDPLQRKHLSVLFCTSSLWIRASVYYTKQTFFVFCFCF